MGHILEMFDPNKTITSNAMVVESIRSLMARMHDVKSTYPEGDPHIFIIESWRNELMFIRSAVEKMK